jgi:RNA polymerase sigma-70 factor (ECF subfamily)
MPAPESSLSDESLVTSTLGAGGAASFAQLVRRYEKAARAACLVVLNDHHLACDAAQEAFISAYKSLAKLRDRSSFGGWILTIAHNRALRLARHRRRTGAFALPTSDPPDCKPADLELLSAISALPEHERIVIMLRYFQNHDVSTVAEILDRPIGTITKQLSRAHERLRRALTQETRP